MDLDQLPLVNYQLLKNMVRMDFIPVMTSRGCPFDCNLCTVTKIFGRKFRRQSPHRVIREIKHALRSFKTRDIFFYDDNFTADPKRAGVIFDEMIRQNLPISFSMQTRSDVASQPGFLEKMRRAGCNRVFIGFESINDDTLKALHKSQTRADVENAIVQLHRHGILIHGMFILGEDNDTPENITNTVDFAIEKDIDTVQFMVLTPFPGTKVYEDLKQQGRIYHENWDNYDGMYIVYRPKRMTAVKLQQACIAAYRRFYSLRRTVMDSLRFATSISLDALVWNFRRLYKYDLSNVFVRFGAKLIVRRWSQINRNYLKFLENADLA
jgi:radical SAM superfamily enzyme YgiQ (UPF0313 family)